ncbi:unnamed protein product, partial [Mesorhabditis spiculigera]
MIDAVDPSSARFRSETYYVGKRAEMLKRKAQRDRRMSERQEEQLAVEAPSASTSTSSNISTIPEKPRIRHVSTGVLLQANGSSDCESTEPRRSSVACTVDAARTPPEKLETRAKTQPVRPLEKKRVSHPTYGSKTALTGPAITPRLRYTREKSGQKPRNDREECTIL